LTLPAVQDAAHEAQGAAPDGPLLSAAPSDPARAAWLEARTGDNRSVLDAAHAAMRGALVRRDVGTECADGADQMGAVLRVLLPGCQPELPGRGSRRYDMVRSALRSTTVKVRRVELGPGWWGTTAMPMVGFRPDGQPVGLVPRRAGYDVYDPRTGRRQRAGSAAAGELDSEAVALYRALPAGARSLWSLVRFSLQGSSGDATALVLAGVTAAVIGLCVPIASGTFVPWLLVSGGHHEVLWLGLLLGCATAGFALFQLVRNAAALRLQGRFQTVLEPAVWSRLLSLDARFFTGFTTGDLVQRANAIAEVRAALSGSVISALMGAFFSVASLGVITAIDVPLGILTLAGALVLVAFLVGFAKRQQRYESEVFRLYGEVYGHLYGVLLGIDKIQVAGREVQAFGRWANFFARQKSADTMTQRYQARLSAFMAAAQPFLLLVVLGGVVVLGLHPSAGHLVVVGVAIGQVVLVLGQLSQVAASIFSTTPILDRLRPVLDAPPERGTGARDPGPLQGAVCLDDVSFTYEGAVAPAVAGLTIAAEPGEMVAIVGPSGAGKSTIVRLLLGFEEPDSGRVVYDDKDLADVDPRLVRRQLGVVMQQTRLVRGSVLDNLTTAAPEATEADAWRAAELAGIADMIHALPLGMHTPVGESNQTFSGGQLQRLQIARALVKRPPVLVLDEATSALDNTTQQFVADRVADLDTTRIVIAHRLSTIRRADRIYVLEAGRVAEVGTYEELLQAQGLFTRLVQRQELA